VGLLTEVEVSIPKSEKADRNKNFEKTTSLTFSTTGVSEWGGQSSAQQMSFNQFFEKNTFKR